VWYRVFGLNDATPALAELVAAIHAAGVVVVPHFRGDDLGWTEGELTCPGGGSPVMLSRYLTTEDDLRDDLNTHAAELETMDYSPANGPLMEHVIRTRQLITIRKPVSHPDESAIETVCEHAARFLATTTEGVYQVDGRGWHATGGELLLAEY
jgi:hypothetical protein